MEQGQSPTQARQRKNPHRLSSVRVHFHQIKSLAVTYFHIDKVDTSIGAERFHFRVRKGIGWFPLAMAARQTGRNGGWSCPAPAANSHNLFRRLVALKSSIDTHTRFDVRQIAWVLYGQASRAISTG